MRIPLSIRFVGTCLVALIATDACRDASTGPAGDAALHVVWHVPTKGTGDRYWAGVPAVDAGRLFLEDANTVLALDAATGRQLWARPVRQSPFPPPTTLLARDGRVYLSETDSVLAMDQATGRTIWNFHPDSQAVVTPALDETSLYTGQRGVPVVYALTLAEGALRWRVNLGAGYQYAAYVRGLSVAGDTVYAAIHRDLAANGYLSSGVLVALDRHDGRELWRYETVGSHSAFRGAPFVTGRVVVALDYLGGAVVGIDQGTHQVTWRTELGSQDAPLAAVLLESTVYVGGSYGTTVAIDPATGTVRWRSAVGGSVLGIGICAGQVFANEDRIRRLDAATGRITGHLDPSTRNLPFTSYIAGDGARAYFTGVEGAYAVDCR